MGGSLQTYRRGMMAETIAAIFLRLKGYRVLAQRYKTPVGEIDLILVRGRTLVFCEVKSRMSIDAALHAIGPRGQARITRASLYAMADPRFARFAGADLRFDVVAVRHIFSLRHLDNAWLATQ